MLANRRLKPYKTTFLGLKELTCNNVMNLASYAFLHHHTVGQTASHDFYIISESDTYDKQNGI